MIIMKLLPLKVIRQFYFDQEHETETIPVNIDLIAYIEKAMKNGDNQYYEIGFGGNKTYLIDEDSRQRIIKYDLERQ